MSENYAIIKSGAKQYRVHQGETVMVEKFGVAVGGTCTFDQVIAVGSAENLKIGEPLLAGATVTGTILQAVKQKKTISFQHRKRKTHRKKTGHRQELVAVRIDSIKA
jgi:large subunit ribosomal protein L21